MPCARRAIWTRRWHHRSVGRCCVAPICTGDRAAYYPALQHTAPAGEESLRIQGHVNPTYPHKGKRPYGWVTPWHYGVNQGPIVIMIENYRTGFLWRLMQRCPYVVTGLRRAGFRNGWLKRK